MAPQRGSGYESHDLFIREAKRRPGIAISIEDWDRLKELIGKLEPNLRYFQFFAALFFGGAISLGISIATGGFAGGASVPKTIAIAAAVIGIVCIWSDFGYKEAKEMQSQSLLILMRMIEQRYERPPLVEPFQED